MVRNKWVHVKVSDDEHAQWRQLAEAHGVSVADLIRRSVGGFQLTRRTPPVRRKPSKRVDPDLIRELGRIGNNLNQIGRWANTYKSDAEADQVLAALIALERDLAEIRAEHSPARLQPEADDAD
ncbi:plasmid mobilization relaxosome protein MobC [Halospina sp. K52047b]|uniref:plasmid mobilization protein n=1 Tax=Halospina sp. K52047b TaxID=2614160 RepID=UPI001787F8CF|nr:plasmid mobilization relaxosome protein MobC [Halospina sp. K52047b]